MTNALHVVAGVIGRPAGHVSSAEVLLAQRLPGKHLAGLWELPGGKVECREPAYAALQRELREELGVAVTAARRVMRFEHVYSNVLPTGTARGPNLRIDFDVWVVVEYAGQPRPFEGQQLRWARPEQMDKAQMPAASWPVIDRLRAVPGGWQGASSALQIL